MTGASRLDQQMHQTNVQVNPWINVRDRLPEESMPVMTKIQKDEVGHSLQILKRIGSLWFLADESMYVYYTPTHWKRASWAEELPEK